MFKNLVQNSWSKKFIVVLALSIGTMPLQMLAAPKPARTLPKQTPAQVKKAEQDKKAAVEKKENEEFHKIISLIIQDSVVEYFIEDYCIVLYGLGAQKAAERLKLMLNKMTNSHVTVVGFEGPNAKETAFKLRESIKRRARIVNWIEKGFFAIGGVIVLIFLGKVIGRRLLSHHVNRLHIRFAEDERRRLEQGRLQIVPIAEDIHNNILQRNPAFQGADNFTFARNWLIGLVPHGEGIRNEVVQNAHFYGTITQEQFQQAQGRIYDLQLIARHRNMLPENATQTLIREFPDDIATVGFYHLRNNRFNRIRQMPQVIRNFLVDAMIERHIESLRNLYDTLRQGWGGWGNLDQPALPEREAVHGIMARRMQNIMANAAREE